MRNAPLTVPGVRREVAQRDVSTHRMGEKERRNIRVYVDEAREKCVEVADIAVVPEGMHLVAVRKVPVRPALTPPVDVANGNPAGKEVVIQFEPLLRETTEPGQSDRRRTDCLARTRIGPTGAKPSAVFVGKVAPAPIFVLKEAFL